jgi:hypothetical protein
VADTGIDCVAVSDHDAQAMIEPAALIPPASAGPLVLPSVTDGFRDEELDVLETKVTGAEIALRDGRYDDVVAFLGDSAGPQVAGDTAFSITSGGSKDCSRTAEATVSTRPRRELFSAASSRSRNDQRSGD